MQAPPQVESHLWSSDVIRYYLQFPAAIPNPGVGTYTLLSRSPLSPYCYGSRSTCMPNPRRQRSLWARIEPFNLLLAIHASLSRGASVLRGEFHSRRSESETAGGKSWYSICLLIQFPTRLPPHSRRRLTTIQSVPVTRSRAGRNRKRSTAELSKNIPRWPHMATTGETQKSSRPFGQVNAPRRPGLEKSVPRGGECQPQGIRSIRIA